MSKEIKLKKDARTILSKGIDTVIDTVKITLGPRGRNVILEQTFGPPVFTNDGVRIAKEIELVNKFENTGAEIAKGVAVKANKLGSDGTTTCLVLFQEIVSKGIEAINNGANGVGLRLGIEAASEAIQSALNKLAIPVKDDSQIKQVAIISSESKFLGEIVADIVKKVGKDGIVTVEESHLGSITSDIIAGMEFDQGFISTYMETDNVKKEAVFENPYILLTDKKITSSEEMIAIIEVLKKAGKKELVILADEIQDAALSDCVLNKIHGTFSILGIRIPGFGIRRKDNLQDIAKLVGAQVISDESLITLSDLKLDMLGRAGKIVSTKENTTIIGAPAKHMEIYINELKMQLSKADAHESQYLLERIAKLAGGIAVIKVGAATEGKMKYLKDKIDDAVAATQFAIQEGIVPGGGIALIKAAENMEKLHSDIFEDEFNQGVKIVLESLIVPLKQMLINAGLSENEIDRIEIGVTGTTINKGYDVLKNIIVDDMIKEGIIDPVKVVKSSFLNAASEAAIFLTSEAVIVEKVS